MSTNINVVAAKLELSKGTVSRILKGKGLAFSPQTRERVFAVAEELGYRPNQTARALATGRTGFIALWMQHLRTSRDLHVVSTFEIAFTVLRHICASGYKEFNR